MVSGAMFSVLLFLLTTLQAAVGMTSESNVLFHHLDATPCSSEKLVPVAIDGVSINGVQTIILKLFESSRDFVSVDSPADRQFILRQRPCYYQGQVLLADGKLTGEPAVAKVSAEGMFSGTFHHNGTAYEVPPQPAGSRLSTLRCRRLPPSSGSGRRCPAIAAAAMGEAHRERHRRTAPAVLALDTRSDVGQAARKFIQLVLVSDEAYFRALGSDTTKTQDRLWEIGNYVNSMYKQLGVNVVTVRAIVWTADPYTLANKSSAVNSSEMLDKFMDYRMQFLSDVQHSVIHLVSGLRMTGTDVGLAHMGRLCHFALGGGVNSDTDASSSAINVAVTVAHELGHNLGMNHDEDDKPCSCLDPQGCIMKAVGGDVNPLRFSTCSVSRYLEFTVDAGLGYCMSRQPEAAVKLATDAPRCGNRIVEAGEECDCGTAAWCNNVCCNPATCKLAPGARCASGQCCDPATCSLVPRGAVCRAARPGSCDLPEFCNGASEWCPEVDDFLLDGTACATGEGGQVLAYCYLGECVTRDRRCSELFSGTNYRDAPEAAYNLNLEPNRSDRGYCSYKTLTYNPLTYGFSSCSADNRRCGTLYCTGTSSSSLPVPRWKSLDPFDAQTVSYTVGVDSVEVARARLDLRPSGYRDPGMVPNGAECGSGMMCVDSRCQAVAAVAAAATGGRALPSCNGNGRWTRSLQCFCSAGYRPPDCLLPGAGGSASSQPAANDKGASSGTSSSPVNSSQGAKTTPATSSQSSVGQSDFGLRVALVAAAVLLQQLGAAGLLP